MKFLVLCLLVGVVVADPGGSRFPFQRGPLKEPSLSKRFFQIFGFGGEEPTPPPTQFDPCGYPIPPMSTTTPSPAMPLRPLPCSLQGQPPPQPQPFFPEPQRPIEPPLRPPEPMPLRPFPERPERPEQPLRPVQEFPPRPLPNPPPRPELPQRPIPEQPMKPPYPPQPYPPQQYPPQQYPPQPFPPQQFPPQPFPQPVPEPSEPIPFPQIPMPFGACTGPTTYIPPGFNIPDASATCGRPDVPPCPVPELFSRLRLRIIYSLIQKSNLEPLFLQTSNYTFFAPVDPAFQKLPKWFMESLYTDPKLLNAFILNHFVKVDLPLMTIANEMTVMNNRPGGNRLRFNVYFQEQDYRIYTVDGSRILQGNFLTNTGRIHLIDKPLIPSPIRNAAEYMAEVSDFSEFLGAIVDTKMLPLFQDLNNPITVFIPYNPAFKFFDYQAMEGNISAIQNFVRYHMVPGTFYSSALLSGQYLTTLFEKEVKISITSDGYSKTLSLLNSNIRVLKADIPLTNGVAHIIDHCITTEPGFYYHEEMSEFSYDFGTLKRSSVLDKKQMSEGI